MSTQWDLICDLKWVKATVTSLQMAGVLVGAVVAGQTGDHLGRKPTCYGFYLYHILVNAGAAMSVSWEMFAAFRFLIGIGIGKLIVLSLLKLCFIS